MKFSGSTSQYPAYMKTSLFCFVSQFLRHDEVSGGCCNVCGFLKADWNQVTAKYGGGDSPCSVNKQADIRTHAHTNVHAHNERCAVISHHSINPLWLFWVSVYTTQYLGRRGAGAGYIFVSTSTVCRSTVWTGSYFWLPGCQRAIGGMSFICCSAFR